MRSPVAALSIGMVVAVGCGSSLHDSSQKEVSSQFDGGATRPTDGGGSGGPTGTGGMDGSIPTTADGGPCFTIPAVDHVRFYPRAGQASRMVGGIFMGSNMSPTNGFTNFATISAAPPAGQWTDLPLPNTTSYRYVKYYGPMGSYGDVAEIQFSSGGTQVTGSPFGTPSADEMTHTAQSAFDGDVTTYYEGGVPNDQYVGIDLGASHTVVAPMFSPAAGRFTSTTMVTISDMTPGATIRYTTDGSDPSPGKVYSGPIQVSATTIVKAIASVPCMLDSSVAETLYSIGAASKMTQSSLHIGNSLTGNIVTSFPAAAAAGGFNLAFNFCTSAGLGTEDFWDHSPSCDAVAPGAVSNAKTAAMTKPFDHLVLQPFADNPCTPYGSDGDATYVNDFYQLAKAQNANVQLWIYAQWPQPTASDWSMVDCFANGSPNDMPPWVPPMAATDWETAEMNHLAYHEAVRSGVATMNPGGKTPLIVPVGLALLNLKHAVEAGSVHNIATTDFFSTIFDGGVHLSDVGAYFDALVFYACLFQTSPVGLMQTDLPSAEATDFQNIVWQTVLNYQWSGLQ
jgi:hypothetical protein